MKTNEQLGSRGAGTIFIALTACKSPQCLTMICDN